MHFFKDFHNQNARLSNKVRIDYVRAIITTTPYRTLQKGSLYRTFSEHMQNL